jgi:hypothetical protein
MATLIPRDDRSKASRFGLPSAPYLALKDLHHLLGHYRWMVASYGESAQRHGISRFRQVLAMM